MAQGESSYRVLGLAPGATWEQIKQAYRRLAKQWHPDRVGKDPERQREAVARLQAINAAYEYFKSQARPVVEATPPSPTVPRVAVDRADPRAYYDWGRAALERGDAEAAIAFFSAALHLQPDYLEVYQARAFVYEQRGFTHRAAADFRRVAELQAQATTPPSPPPRAAQGWRQEHTLQVGSAVTAVAFHPQQPLVGIGFRDGTVAVWNWAGRPLHQVREHQGAVQAVLWQGQQWLSLGQDGTVKRWRLSGSPALATLTGHQGRVLSGVLSHDGTRLAIGGSDRTVQLWHLAPWQRQEVVRGYGAEVIALTAAPTASLFASGGLEPHIRIRDFRTGKLKRSLRSNGGVLCLAYSANGQFLAAGGCNAIAQRWSLVGSDPPQQLLGHGLPITAIAFSPDNHYLVTGSADRTIRLWSVDSGEPLATLTGHADGISALHVASPHTLYSASGDGTLYCWQQA